MVNSLTFGDDDLVPVDYSDLLDKISGVLQTQNPFTRSNDNCRLVIDLDAIATQVASLQIIPPLGSFERQAHSATVNLTAEVEVRFRIQIRQIREYLRQHLETILGGGEAVERFVTSLIAPLDSPSFRGSDTELGFKYNFPKHSTLEKKKLTLQRLDSSTQAILKLHKLTISVRNSDIFQQQLREGLEKHINENTDNREDREHLKDRLDDVVQDESSNFHKLIRLVDKETLGKLNKEAKITYLEYLLENIRNNSTDRVGIIYLQDLIRRLRLIEEYINDGDKSDGDYEVNYAGVRVNYRDLFSRAEVLDMLPIIPIVAGYLGETNDNYRSERKFIFGLKIKFDNPVQARGGLDAFEYYLNLLNPDSDEHKAELAEDFNRETFVRKVLKIALLYYFVFASRSNPLANDYNPESEGNYQPRESFESVVMPVLSGSNEERKQRMFRGIIQGLNQYNIKVKIDRLKQLLKGFLDRKTILPPRTESRHINIKRGILEQIDDSLTTGRFFNDVLERNPKQALQYITVDNASVNPRAICQLPVNITIEDVRYFPTDERQSFSMEYNIKGINALPVLLTPRGESSKDTYVKHFNTKLVVFRYENRRLDKNESGLQPAAAFVYKFTMLLLSYISLKILIENGGKNLFMPMVRLHEGDHNHPSPSEEFMAHLSKTLSHLFSEKHCCNSQGFRIKHKPKEFTIRNGLSSLYSILPKKFRFDNVQLSPELDKLAIIVVSSRESDARKGNTNRLQRKASLIGEIVGINRQEDDSIQVEMLKTFSENYSVTHLYTQPSILEDAMSQLYEQGYRNFAYISQAPYTSTLHITKTDEDEDLFFMSKSLIRTLKGERRDIKIYPIFFDKYFVRSPKPHRGESFYIQDTMELSNLADDPNRQSVMFFNLFNGIKVEQQGDKNFYNGVISYSTLLHIYDGILDDQDIHQNLIYDGQIKDTLLHYLTIFHFSRYEARQNISLKLDPYEGIIGDDSVGALSIFSHAGGITKFNSLAFLNKVRELDNEVDDNDW